MQHFTSFFAFFLSETAEKRNFSRPRLSFLLFRGQKVIDLRRGTLYNITGKSPCKQNVSPQNYGDTAGAAKNSGDTAVMSEKRAVTMDKLVSLCKNRGFIFPGSEIYGGLANSWDYGP